MDICRTLPNHINLPSLVSLVLCVWISVCANLWVQFLTLGFCCAQHNQMVDGINMEPNFVVELDVPRLRTLPPKPRVLVLQSNVDLSYWIWLFIDPTRKMIQVISSGRGYEWPI